jgi:hypothetical protein
MVRGPTALSGPDVVAWDDPTKRNAKLSPGGSVQGPTDPVGRLLFKVLAIRRLATGNARKSTVYRAPGRRARSVRAVDVGLSIDQHAVGQFESRICGSFQVRIPDGSDRG